MADIVLNGTTYSGSPINTSNPQRPVTIQRSRLKLGRLVVAASGAATWVHRGLKWQWTIDWGDKANATTRTAVKALRDQAGTFSFTDTDGASYTVVASGEESYEEGITSDKANAYLYSLKIVLREA